MVDLGATWKGMDASLSPAVEVTTLRELLTALDTAVVNLVDAPAGVDVDVASIALVDREDLSAEVDSRSKMPDLFIHVGIGAAEAIRWFDRIATRPPELRPRAVMSKLGGDSRAIRSAARKAGVALVAVNPQARWDRVLFLVQRMLDRALRNQINSDRGGAGGTDKDLFELAQVVAMNAGGLVSIEDAQSHVLAYSVTDQTADELRTLSILGREGPREYLRVLNEWGVFDRLRASDDVVDVPEHPELGIRRRLVAGVRQAPDDASPPRLLGTIWVQQGDRPFASDAVEVIKGAAAAAARIVSRTIDAPSTEALLVQRLFGFHGGSIDVPSVASMLNLGTTGPLAVIGFAAADGQGTTSVAEFARSTDSLRLHASAFRRDSVTLSMGERSYVLLPGYKSAKTVTTWTRNLVSQFELKRKIRLRAALAVPVADLGHVGDARIEVDRVLDGTAANTPEGRVTTLAESRTAVLLNEILRTISERPELHDPRVDRLFAHDVKLSSNLAESVQAFLAYYGAVRDAAASLQVHPNTLRYRLRKAEQILGIDLQDPRDRLLLELQLALRESRMS